MSTIFKKGSFIDYAGREHKYVIAGVLQSFPIGEMFLNKYIGTDEWDDLYDEYAPIYKVISIGISICNPGNGTKEYPGDTYSDFIGERQAEGRAKKYHDRVIAVSKGGMCTEDAIKFFLDQTASSLESNPGLFIPGYNEAARKYHM